MHQSKEALEIYERLGHTIEQVELARSVVSRRRAAQRSGGSRFSRNHTSSGGRRRILLLSNPRVLGHVYRSKREIGKATHHFETAIQISSPFNWRDELCWNYNCLAQLLCNGKKFDNAQTHVDQAKSFADGNPYHLCRAAEIQAEIWYRQHQLEDAMSEALRAFEIYEKLGASEDAKSCRELLEDISKQSMNDR